MYDTCSNLIVPITHPCVSVTQVLKGERNTENEKEHPYVPRAVADELAGGGEVDSEVHAKLLQDALFSKKMYTHPQLYAKWAGGFQSGLVKGTTQRAQPHPMASTLTIAHEAHFRLEIFLALSRRAYSHPPGLEEAFPRKKLHKKLCLLVKQDRTDNDANAHATRIKAFVAAGGVVAEDGGATGSDDGDFDAEFLQ
jgi:hypothetical protein